MSFLCAFKSMSPTVINPFFQPNKLFDCLIAWQVGLNRTFHHISNESFVFTLLFSLKASRKCASVAAYCM